MKILSIILSIYFLGLNFTPCDDAVAEENEVQTEFSVAADADSDHSSADMCSPFCHCHCCHVHTIDVGMAVFEPLNVIPLQNPLLHFDNLGKDFRNSLFQPPRA